MIIFLRFPFNIEWSPLFEFLFIAGVWSGYMTVAGIYGIDGMFLGLCSQISGQFEIIGTRLKDLIEKNISKHET
jgi:hypothetical protein